MPAPRSPALQHRRRAGFTKEHAHQGEKRGCGGRHIKESREDAAEDDGIDVGGEGSWKERPFKGRWRGRRLDEHDNVQRKSRQRQPD
jgi:hypothetical protein